VDLDSLYHILPVSHPHNLSVLRPGGNLKRSRDGLGINYQRVIATTNQRRGQTTEDSFPVMEDERLLTMYRNYRSLYDAAIYIPDALMPQAYPQNGNPSPEVTNYIVGNPRL